MLKFSMGFIAAMIVFIAVADFYPEVVFRTPNGDIYIDEAGGVWLPVTTAEGEKRIFVFKDGKSFECVGEPSNTSFTAEIVVDKTGIKIESFRPGEGWAPVREKAPDTKFLQFAME